MKYRMLVHNIDCIKSGDQYLRDDCETWETVPIKDDQTKICDGWMIGKIFTSNFFVPFRRPIDENGKDLK